MERLTIQTQGRTEFVDVTEKVARIVEKSGVTDGSCLLFVPHTTAGITINENADPSVRQDILGELERLVPISGSYSHAEGNAAAHIKASIVGFSQVVPVSGGQLALGTWQGIYLCEFDGPRRRHLLVRVA